MSVYAVNAVGHVYVLSPSSSPSWQPLNYVGLELKRLCAASKWGWGERVWALGGDHQLYVLVARPEVMIRVKETIFENQRWNPLDGFCSALLPTDRAHFSTQDGRLERRKDQVQLPSLAWNWDSEWTIEPTLDGRRLQDPQGWSYAVDFPSVYHARKQLTSCVRRRKWIRHRKYVALDTWAPIEPLHRDVAKEPFIDVAIGGQEMKGNNDSLAVWTVTVLGRILVRKGVSQLSPEGRQWIHVDTPQSWEVSQISVAPSGLVWTVTWNGISLVRLGVTSERPEGAEKAFLLKKPENKTEKSTEWCTVESPGPRCQLSQVCVGSTSVWALSRDRRVFFRQGVRSSMNDNVLLSTGSKWMEMVGELSVISIGCYTDHVFGITNDDKHEIVVRTGVSKANPTGHMWKSITAPMECRHQRRRRDNRKGDGRETEHDEKLRQQQHEVDKSMYVSALENLDTECNKKKEEEMSFKDSSMVNEDKEDQHWLWLSAGTFSCDQIPPEWICSRSSQQRDFSPHNELDVKVDYRQVILARLQGLHERVVKVSRTRSFEKAIEFSSWVKKTKAKVINLTTISSSNIANNYPTSPENCVIELELSGQTDTRDSDGKNSASKGSEVDFGTLSIFATNARNKEHLSLLDLSCVRLELSFSQRDPCCIVLHSTTRTLNRQPPIKLEIRDDNERSEWISDIEHGRKGVLGETSSFLGSRSLELPAKRNVVCALSSSGEPLMADLEQEVNDPELKRMDDNRCVRELKLEGMMSNRKSNNSGPFTSTTATLSHFKCKSALSFTLRTHKGQTCPAFSLNLHCGPPSTSDIALHFNPRPEIDTVVVNSRRNGQWEREQRHDFTVYPNTNNDSEDNDKNDKYSSWQRMKLFEADSVVHVLITALQHEFEIVVNGMKYAHFGHRFPCDEITHVRVEGSVTLKAINHIFEKGLPNPSYLVWFPMGDGHFRRMTSKQGFVYALGHDNTPWMFNGELRNNKMAEHIVEDVMEVVTYENQRWRPISGFSSATLLPTDRHAWSDVTGAGPFPKEQFRLPSTKWRWNGDWYVSEVNSPSKNEGWQYATDFPMSYHSQMTLTDCVRRRKWCRRIKYKSKGPWMKLNQSIKLSDIALQATQNGIIVWALSTDGDALVREQASLMPKEQSVHNEVASTWCQLPNGGDERLMAIDVDRDVIWAVGKDGCAYARHGVSGKCPLGQFWLRVMPPLDSKLKDIAVGCMDSGHICIWALDTLNRVYVRLEVTEALIEGTAWKKVDDGVLSIAVNGDQVWAVLNNHEPQLGKGVVARRQGVNKGNPAGFEWNIALGGGFQSVSCS